LAPKVERVVDEAVVGDEAEGNLMYRIVVLLMTRLEHPLKVGAD